MTIEAARRVAATVSAADAGRRLDLWLRPDRTLKRKAIEAIMGRPDAVERYSQMPWMREMAAAIWEDVNPHAAARAIREVLEDPPVPDRELLRAVRAPVIIISMEGDPIHPVAAGEALAEVLPNAELLVFPNQEELLGEIPTLVTRAQEFLS
jgi:pimeloyl-ACP methyl ester carboxylesterase